MPMGAKSLAGLKFSFGDSAALLASVFEAVSKYLAPGATCSMPMLVAMPGRLSTMTGCLSSFGHFLRDQSRHDVHAATAAYGTTMRIGLSGKVFAAYAPNGAASLQPFQIRQNGADGAFFASRPVCLF